MLLVPMPRAHRTNAVAVADVFSVDLYTGTGAVQTITNGINLAGEGGLVWQKIRAAGGYDHVLTDTVTSGTGALTKFVSSNVTNGFDSNEANIIGSYNSNGFTLNSGGGVVNNNGGSWVAWTFRQAAQVFDVVTFTGNGANRTIAHNLGSVPGMIMVKRTDTSTAGWMVYHRSLTSNGYNLVLNTTAAEASNATAWNSTTATASVFSLGTHANVNTNAATYVAYLFAHDPTGVIQCDTYTGNGSATGPTVTLGWQPQYVIIKRTNSTGNWVIYDSTRSTSNPRIIKLQANLTSAEDTVGEDVDFNATSFQLKSTDASINANNGIYAYMAIKAE